MDWLKLIELLKRLSQLRNQSQKNAIMAVSTSIGIVCSIIIGGIIDYFIYPPEKQPQLFYSTSVLASIIILPISYYVGIKLWDFLRSSWLDSNDELKQLKFFEDELKKEIKLLNELEFSSEIQEKRKRELLKEYEHYRFILLNKRFSKRKKLGNRK